jgi:hypothetical protein
MKRTARVASLLVLAPAFLPWPRSTWISAMHSHARTSAEIDATLFSQSFPLMSFSGNRAPKFSKKRFYRIRRKRDRPCKQADSPLENPVRIPAATPCQPGRSLPNAGGTSGRLQHFARTAHRAVDTTKHVGNCSHCAVSPCCREATRKRRFDIARRLQLITSH